jgi:uncharacterized protein YdeI (YjbR/CyaY-like superfamily)
MKERASSVKVSDDPEVFFFETAEKWRKWLEENHQQIQGVWLRFYKKGTGVLSLKYDEALDEALCFGWIDGQAKKYDESSYLQKFTPRRAKSSWSKRNIGHVARLEAEGKMTVAGLKAVADAKADGRWEMALHLEVPADFLQLLKENTEAFSFFNSLNQTNKTMVAWKLQSAKRPETREKRMREMLEMFKKGEKLIM